VTTKQFYKNVIMSVVDLTPYEGNSRTHNTSQIDQIAASIKEWGFTNPILIDEQNTVIAGHGRLLAAQKLKIDKVPCIVLEGLTESQKKAYVIADNRIAELSGWDMSKLIIEAKSLMDEGFDIDLAAIDEIFLGGNINEYKPILEPSFSSEDVTESDVAKTKVKLDNQYEQASKQNLTDVICPNCGEEFKFSGE